MRLCVRSRVELAELRRLLRAAGFAPGRQFRKHRQYVQPIYGRREVARFLELVGADEEA